MDKPLSISGYKRYTLCPRYYYEYDIQGDRPAQNSSPLIIGSVVDKVIGDSFEGKEIDFRQLLLDYQSTKVIFKTDDLDLDFVNLDIVEGAARKAGWKGKDISKALKSFIQDQVNLSDKQYDILALAAWQSIDVKIEAMLTAFDTWIRPKIKRVISVQKYLNKDGKHGYLDFVVELQDGRIVLLDLKTSKNSYDEDAVLTSPQLSLYSDIENIEWAGYVVLVKTLSKNKIKTCKTCDFKETGGNKKNCPTCKTGLDFTMNPTSYAQFLVNKIPQYNKDLTNQAMNDTIKCIDNGIFPRNLNTCKWVFGEPCPYFKKCWKSKETK